MNIFSRLLWLAVWSGLALYLAFTLWLGCAGLVYPYQLDYGEGIVLWFAQEIARGHAIYKPLADFPFASSNYPPVAMLLAAILMPIFGDGYLAGRLLNFASALIVAVLIFRIVRAETRDHHAAILASFFFLGSPYIFHWIPLFRVDLIGLAFTFTALYFAWKREQNPITNASRESRITNYERFARITIFSLLALYTKHTLFAAPLAIFLALFRRDRRAAIQFALTLGASGGAIYLALDALTGGGFSAGLIESNATVFLFDQLIALLKNFVTTFPVLILLAVGSWLARVRRFGVLELYALISFVALAMSGRVGAWENYFFEAIAIACVFAGFQIADFKLRIANRERWARITNYELRFTILLLAQLILFWHDPRIAADLIMRDFPANRDLAALLARTNGNVISEDMGALATSGKPVVYYTFQYSSLARAGKWDQQWEIERLRARAFPLVILERGTREDVDHYRRFTREFVSALDRDYARVQSLGKYEIYAPAPPLNLRAAQFGSDIALVGWRAEPEILKPGKLEITIVWQARRELNRRYTAFAHLERAGDKVTQDDHEPFRGVYPTTRWAVNEFVRDVFVLNVSDDLAPGKYILRIGWYDSDTGDRLAVSGSADDAFDLIAFEVR
jgi:hypothetical protein